MKTESDNHDTDSDPLGVLVALCVFVVLWCMVQWERLRRFITLR